MTQNDISFNLVYRGETLPLRRPAAEKLKDFLEYLESLLGVAANTQKIFFHHNHLAISDALKDQTLAQLGINNGAMVYLVGSKAEDILEIRSLKSNKFLRGFNKDETQKPKEKQTDLRFKTKSNPLIGSFETLPQFNFPPPSKALRLLHRIATDNGVMAIMKRYNWHIGSLKEMPPKGLVGISERCVLGYNVNRGQIIALRLRTDDLKGFRNYNRIIETMLHELCHMVYDEHDSNFWQFFRKLKREYEELDWKRSKGEILFSESSPNEIEARQESDDSLSDFEDNEPQMLNPNFDANVYWTHTPQELAANAAERRLKEAIQKQEQQRQQIQKSQFLPYLQLLERSSPSPQQQEQQFHQQLPKQRSPDNNTPLRSGLAFSAPSTSSTSTSTTTANVSTNFTNKITKLDNENLTSCQQAHSFTASHWDCPSCTFRNELSSFYCTVCNSADPNKSLISASITSQISAALTTEDLNESDIVNTMKDSLNKVGQKIDKALDSIIRETNPEECKITLETLLVILKNILENPKEQKYRHLYFTNKNFWTKVGRHLSAIAFLKVVGFQKDQDRDGLVLRRDDFALLWLAKSALENRLLILQ